MWFLLSSVNQFGFAETDVTVQDPVSLDVSMPRFVTPTDTITVK